MRGLFRQNAQRDVLRQKETNIEQDNKQDNNPGAFKKAASRKLRLPGHKHIVSAFLLAALGNEATHFHVPQNPHGNRRERIEEIRLRSLEAEIQAKRFRMMSRNSGGGTPAPFHPVEVATQEARRRNASIRPANNA
jgi:hypothetical protein